MCAGQCQGPLQAEHAEWQCHANRSVTLPIMFSFIAALVTDAIQKIESHDNYKILSVLKP